MTTPTDRHIHNLLRPLHNLQRADITNGPTRLDTLEQRILAAVHRNRAGTTRTRDGYPSGAGPGDGGEDAAQSSTEAAALTNLTTTGRDPIDTFTHEIVATLTETVGGLARLHTLLGQLDKLSDPRHTINQPSSCQACNRTVMCTAADPIRKGYCSACSSAFYRWSEAETEAGRDPDRARFERQRQAETAA